MRNFCQSFFGALGVWAFYSGPVLAQVNGAAEPYKACEITYATREFVTHMDQTVVEAFLNLDIKTISNMIEFPLRIRDAQRSYYIKSAESFRNFFPNVLNSKWLAEFNRGSYFRCRGNEYQYGNGLIGILANVEDKTKPFKIVVLSVVGAESKPVASAQPVTLEKPVSSEPKVALRSRSNIPTSPQSADDAFRCLTEQHVILVDRIDDATFRYQSFGVETGPVGKPQLELRNGKREVKTSRDCSLMSYAFVNVDTTYRLDQMPCSSDPSRTKYSLAVIRGKKVIDEWTCLRRSEPG